MSRRDQYQAMVTENQRLRDKVALLEQELRNAYVALTRAHVCTNSKEISRAK